MVRVRLTDVENLSPLDGSDPRRGLVILHDPGVACLVRVVDVQEPVGHEVGVKDDREKPLLVADRDARGEVEVRLLEQPVLHVPENHYPNASRLLDDVEAAGLTRRRGGEGR